MFLCTPQHRWRARHLLANKQGYWALPYSSVSSPSTSRSASLSWLSFVLHMAKPVPKRGRRGIIVFSEWNLGLNYVTFNNIHYVTIHLLSLATISNCNWPNLGQFCHARETPIKKACSSCEQDQITEDKPEAWCFRPRWRHRRQPERELCQVPVRVWVLSTGAYSLSGTSINPVMSAQTNSSCRLTGSFSSG